jgi:hypothetical protein
MDYELIKAIAKSNGLKVTDLIALAPQNDPFYVGTEGARREAEWFAELYHRFGAGRGVHVRRIHYQVVSQASPVTMPNGKPYENTEECWKFLSQASKRARYLHLVDADDFDDRRNAEPQDFGEWVDTDTELTVSSGSWFTPSLPDFPEPPSYSLTGFDSEQRYHLEIWCEKSTMNDVLEPLARRYGAVLQIGVGELSVTRTLALAQRLADKDKPARIFYVSDFDPAGKSMPVAVARKLEYFAHDLGLDIDARLFPLVLTEDQCREYQLPRTPIKETELRARRFEERFGEGATELDALQALYPGVLAQIIEGAMLDYYDADLADRVAEARAELGAALRSTRDDVLSSHRPEIDALRTEYQAIREAQAAQLTDWNGRRNRIWLAISVELEEQEPDLDDYPVPEAGEVDEEGAEPLYDSQRDYIEQINAYKAFQGKGVRLSAPDS